VRQALGAAPRPPARQRLRRPARTFSPAGRSFTTDRATQQGGFMNGIIYLVGLVVVILAVLSFLGLR
jgi:hypothetical protein